MVEIKSVGARGVEGSVFVVEEYMEEKTVEMVQWIQFCREQRLAWWVSDR